MVTFQEISPADFFYRNRDIAGFTNPTRAIFSAIRELVETARNLGVHTLTIWGWSTENWSRPVKERNKILGMVKRIIQEELENAEKEGVRFIHLGRKDKLPKDLLKWLKKAEEETKNNKKYILNIALDYGGKDEILRAVQNIVNDKVPTEKIDEKLFLYLNKTVQNSAKNYNNSLN